MFWIVVSLVFLNTCVQATEHHNQPDWLSNFQEFIQKPFKTLTFEYTGRANPI